MNWFNFGKGMSNAAAVNDENQADFDDLQPQSDISRTVRVGGMLLLAGLLGFLLWQSLPRWIPGCPRRAWSWSTPSARPSSTSPVA